jgi:hypothetical protein
MDPMTIWSETLETWLMQAPFLQDRESAAKLLTHQYILDRLASLAGVVFFAKVRCCGDLWQNEDGQLLCSVESIFDTSVVKVRLIGLYPELPLS